ncbi:MAG: hypothetical protein JJU37_15305 [Balneolaceae bacterium]|nr:hypothetical protein [Balneolaceae bacterium]
MKTILTQNTLFLFAILFIAAFSFTACNDMVSPNDAEINNGITSEEYEGAAEARRRAVAAAQAAADADNSAPTSCTMQSELLGYGFDKNQTGTVTPSIDGDKLFIKFQAIGNWKFSETKVYVSNVPPSGGGWRGFDSVDHNPKVAEVTREVNISSFNTGDTIYIAAKGQSHNPNVQNGNGQTATAGEEGPFNAHFTYFKITKECPPAEVSGSFNGAN